MASVKHFFTLGIMWGELAYGEVPFRLVITEWGYVGTCTAQRRSLCLFYGFYGKGLGEKEQLSLLDDGAVLFHSLLCFPFFFILLWWVSLAGPGGCWVGNSHPLGVSFLCEVWSLLLFLLLEILSGLVGWKLIGRVSMGVVPSSKIG